MGQSWCPPSQSQSRFPPSICQALTLPAAVPLWAQEQSRSLSFPTYWWYWDKSALFLESKLEQNECINVQHGRDWAHISLELGNTAWSGICLQMSQPFSTLLKPLSCSAARCDSFRIMRGWKKPQGRNIFLLVQERRERVRWGWREWTWNFHQRLWKVEASQQCFFLHQPWEHQSPLYSCSGNEFYKAALSKPSWWSFLRARCFFYL